MKEDIASIARIVTPIAEKYGVERVALFGSRARGDAGAKSDYDFVIRNGGIRSLFTLAAFLTDLENALHAPVDLISDTFSDREFLTKIQREEVPLYERQGQADT
ncbi:MAG: nucleotidyltransferase domain-containing protein [Oscillibacter sp.]|nr:nucleotidyltransferase domain-containing protein [Oscillibacter sp.]